MISYDGPTAIATCVAFTLRHWRTAFAEASTPARKAAALALVQQDLTPAQWWVDTENCQIFDPSQPQRARELLEEFMAEEEKHGGDLRGAFEDLIALASEQWLTISNEDTESPN